MDTQGQNLINTAGAGNYTGTDANGNAIDPTALGSQIKSYNYTGPTGLTNANQLQTNAATASALGQLAGNTSGQEQLLRNYVGGSGNYTQGQSTFDQALLNKYGQAPISQAAQGLQGLGSQVQAGIDTSTNLANQQKNLITNQKSQLQQSATNALNGPTGSSGLMGQTLAQGTAFNKDATNLQSLMGSINTIITGTPEDKANAIAAISQMTDSQGNPVDVNNLIGKFAQMGLDVNGSGLNNLYQNTSSNYNQSQLGDIFKTIGNTNLATAGNNMFQGNQLASANALAAFTGQAPITDTFNTNLYGTAGNNITGDLSNLANEQTNDTTMRSIIQQMNAAAAKENPLGVEGQNSNNAYNYMLNAATNSGLNTFNPLNSSLTPGQQTQYAEYFAPQIANQAAGSIGNLADDYVGGGTGNVAPKGVVSGQYYNGDQQNWSHTLNPSGSQSSQTAGLNNAVIQNLTNGSSTPFTNVASGGGTTNFQNLIDQLTNYTATTGNGAGTSKVRGGTINTPTQGT